MPRCRSGTLPPHCTSADVVFGNLECCLHLPSRRSHATEGFFADPQIGGEALRLSGIHAVGIANNVNYGADNIAASIARLDQLGIPHTGAGPNLAAARAPVIVARNGLRVGAVQRSSVYWPTDHEAHAEFARHRGHSRPYRLSRANQPRCAGRAAAEPARRAAGDRDLGGQALSR